jgi:hypothetical protein
MKLLATALLAMSLPLMGAPLKLKTSSVVFEATGNPGFLTIEGSGASLIAEKLESDGKVIWGTFKVPVLDLTTGMDLRDEHMRKYLGADKHPYARLILQKTPLGAKTFKGLLTVKKDTKLVKGTISIKGDKVKAKFEINLADFPSIGTPAWKGISVADEVTVDISAILKHHDGFTTHTEELNSH